MQWLHNCKFSSLRDMRSARGPATPDCATGPPGYRSQVLPRVQLPACVQVVKVQNRVEDQEVAPDRFAAPHRIAGEQYHVALLERRIHDDRALRDIAAAI